MYFLVKNPETYRRLQQEIDQADEQGKLSEYVTYSECLQLPYLYAFHFLYWLLNKTLNRRTTTKTSSYERSNAMPPRCILPS